MALRKSQLYGSLWQSCDELRGGMDASQYKDYVLTLLFVKYVSDKYAGKPNPLIEVPEGGDFADMVKLRGDKEIGDKINKIVARLAKENTDLQGVIDQADFNDESKLGSGKEMQDRLSKLVGIFAALDLRANRAEGDDLLGDAYEYLMRNFATESGKSKGQFYTPAEVSRIMAKVIGLGPGITKQHTIYDPTCGSGSLLIKSADETDGRISVYGQEMDNATWALAKMNMVLHGHASAVMWRGNTLAAPHFKGTDGGLRAFDFAVANPPFSAKSWTNGVDLKNDEFGRFVLGEPPSKNGDYAFLLHLVASLKSTGTGAIILPHGVLFRGNREGDIRRNLIRRGLIKGIIGLPANLFYGTGIPACIVVVDKAGAATRTGVFMVDASKGFVKDGPKNRLRSQDIHRIVDVFTRQAEVAGFSRMVPLAEIESPTNGFNLNLPRYVDTAEPEDRHDLDAHLNGGIPDRDVEALSDYWAVFPGLRGTLFGPGDRQGYSRACLQADEVLPAITGHPEFVAYAGRVRAIFDGWWGAHEATLRGLKVNDLPKEVIAALSEDLLRRFRDVPLIDGYDVYQRLMNYWAVTMQDDVYAVAADGWSVSAAPRPVIEDKERKIKETPDLVVGKKKWKMDLVPPALVLGRFFGEERAELDGLHVRAEAAVQALAELVEEHSGEDGAVTDDPTEKITKGNLNARLKAARKDLWLADDGDEAMAEIAVLERCLELLDADAAATKAKRTAESALDAEVLARYSKLSDEEIKTLVVEDKWLAALMAAVDGEVQGTMRRLAGRVRQLEHRYEQPMPCLVDQVRSLEAKVEEHLLSMGLGWA